MKRDYLFYIPFLLIIFVGNFIEYIPKPVFYAIFLLIVILSFLGFLDVLFSMVKFFNDKSKLEIKKDECNDGK